MQEYCLQLLTMHLCCCQEVQPELYGEDLALCAPVSVQIRRSEVVLARAYRPTCHAPWRLLYFGLQAVSASSMTVSR